MAKNNYRRNKYKDKDRDKGKDFVPEKRDESQSKTKDGKGYPKTRGSNDFAWHAPANDVELLERASVIPWTYQTGETLVLQDDLQYGVGQSWRCAQPGFMVIRDIINCGPVGRDCDLTNWDLSYMLPTRNAANTLLTEMRSRTRVRNTYDAPDVFMLMNAMLDIYSGVFLAKRLAGTIRMFSYKNEYMPEDLFRAQGFDPDWFKDKGHAFTFITDLNVLISEINKVYIPSRMGIFKVANERYSNYYTEGSDIRDQIYFFTPAMLSHIGYNPNADYASWLRPLMVLPGRQTGTTYSDPNQWITVYDASNLYTGDDLIHTLRAMLDCVVTMGETDDITGDMKNAFGDAEAFILPTCDPTLMALPVFDEEMLETIRNLTLCRAVSYAYQTYNSANADLSSEFHVIQRVADNRIGMFDVYKDLKTSAGNEKVYSAENLNRLIDVHRDPDSHKTFAISRLRNYPIGYKENSIVSTGDAWAVKVYFSTDLICEVEVWGIDPTTGVTTSEAIRTITYSLSTPFVRAILLSAAFHYVPTQLCTDNNGNVSGLHRWVTGESDIYAELARKDQKVMDRISQLSLLGAYNNVK